MEELSTIIKQNQWLTMTLKIGVYSYRQAKTFMGCKGSSVRITPSRPYITVKPLISLKISAAFLYLLFKF